MNLEILMAVYNNGDYIVAQLESILEQTYPHFRILIRDDCSTDNSVALITHFAQKHPDKILLIQGKENLGAKDNFAALLQYTKADYILFSDADDVWLPTKIEESMALMQKNEGIYGKRTPLLIHTDLVVVDRQLHPLHHSFWDYAKIHPYTAQSLNRILVQNVITGCTMLINRPLLQLAKEIPTEAIMHDWWLGLVASALGRIDCVPKGLVLYRQHGKNHTGAKSMQTDVKKMLHFTGRQEMRQRLLKTMEQAFRFSQSYGKQLNAQQKQMVDEYASLQHSKALKKRILFFKYRYFKNSFARNVGMFFLM